MCVVTPLRVQGHSMMPRGGWPGYINMCVCVCVCVGVGVGVCVCVCIYVCVLEVVALSQQHYLCSQLVLLLLGVPNLATG